MSDSLRLVTPALAYLPAYQAALEAGWSADNVNGAAAAQRERDWIARDAPGFLASLDDPQARGVPIALPDGASVPRLPSVRRWIWDGDFCGSIGLRWQHGTSRLPPHVMGHIGFAVVPWKRGHGYAARALAALLPEAKSVGLDYVELTATDANPASCRTIEHCGGRIVERFADPVYHAGEEIRRYRIDL